MGISFCKYIVVHCYKNFSVIWSVFVKRCYLWDESEREIIISHTFTYIFDHLITSQVSQYFFCCCAIHVIHLDNLMYSAVTEWMFVLIYVSTFWVPCLSIALRFKLLWIKCIFALYFLSTDVFKDIVAADIFCSTCT